MDAALDILCSQFAKQSILMPNLVTLGLLLAFLSVLQGIKFGHIIESKVMLLEYIGQYVHPPCVIRIPIFYIDRKINITFKSDDCVNCQSEKLQKYCKRRAPGVCKLKIIPVSTHVKMGMKICVNLAQMNTTFCNSGVYLGAHTYSPNLLVGCNKPGEEQCASQGHEMIIRFEAYNFCSFEGLITVTTKPAFYRLQFDCPSNTEPRRNETVMSYYPLNGQPYEKMCPVFFKRPSETNFRKRVCIKLRHVLFPIRGTAKLILQTHESHNPEALEEFIISSSNSPLQDKWQCFYGQVDEISFGLENGRGDAGHSLILDFDFDLDESKMPWPGDDSSSGLSNRGVIIAIGTVSALVFLFCCCCLRRSKKVCDEDEDIADTDNNINVPFDTEDAPGLTNLSQRDMDEPVVHSTVRGTLEVMNQSDTPNHSSSPSRNHHLDHIPLSTASNDSSYRDLASDEDETSLQFLSPEANEASSSLACGPPPSYDSLFPDAGQNR